MKKLTIFCLSLILSFSAVADGDMSFEQAREAMTGESSNETYWGDQLDAIAVIGSQSPEVGLPVLIDIMKTRRLDNRAVRRVRDAFRDLSRSLDRNTNVVPLVEQLFDEREIRREYNTTLRDLIGQGQYQQAAPIQEALRARILATNIDQNRAYALEMLSDVGNYGHRQSQENIAVAVEVLRRTETGDSAEEALSLIRDDIRGRYEDQTPISDVDRVTLNGTLARILINPESSVLKNIARMTAENIFEKRGDNSVPSLLLSALDQNPVNGSEAQIENRKNILNNVSQIGDPRAIDPTIQDLLSFTNREFPDFSNRRERRAFEDHRRSAEDYLGYLLDLTERGELANRPNLATDLASITSYFVENQNRSNEHNRYSRSNGAPFFERRVVEIVGRTLDHNWSELSDSKRRELVEFLFDSLRSENTRETALRSIVEFFKNGRLDFNLPDEVLERVRRCNQELEERAAARNRRTRRTGPGDSLRTMAELTRATIGVLRFFVGSAQLGTDMSQSFMMRNEEALKLATNADGLDYLRDVLHYLQYNGVSFN